MDSVYSRVILAAFDQMLFSTRIDTRLKTVDVDVIFVLSSERTFWVSREYVVVAREIKEENVN